MSYWGREAAENDYAFDAVGAYVFLIVDRMFKDARTVIEKRYPEQGIVASLQCIRSLSVQFPKCVSVHFRRKHFDQAREAFHQWYELVKDQLPAKHRDGVRQAALTEFRLFESEVL